MSHKQKVKARRLSAITALVLTVLMFLQQRSFDSSDPPLHPQPHFLPLDFAVAYTFGFMLFFLALSGVMRDGGVDELGLTKLVTGMVVVFGSMIGYVITVLNGWRAGLQGFVLGCAIVFCLVAILASIGWAVENFDKWGKPVLQPLFNKLQSRPSVQQARRYLNADDVPDTSTSEE